VTAHTGTVVPKTVPDVGQRRQPFGLTAQTISLAFWASVANCPVDV